MNMLKSTSEATSAATVIVSVSSSPRPRITKQRPPQLSVRSALFAFDAVYQVVHALELNSRLHKFLAGRESRLFRCCLSARP